MGDRFARSRWETSASLVAEEIRSTKKFVVVSVSPGFSLSIPSVSVLTNVAFIGDDLDGVRSLYVRRFGAIAKAHRSLQTIIWTPSAEVQWTWNFFRNGDKVTFKEDAKIIFNKGPQGDIPQSAVLMLE